MLARGGGTVAADLITSPLLQLSMLAMAMINDAGCAPWFVRIFRKCTIAEIVLIVE